MLVDHKVRIPTHYLIIAVIAIGRMLMDIQVLRRAYRYFLLNRSHLSVTGLCMDVFRKLTLLFHGNGG